jgi:hypothetical protein
MSKSERAIAVFWDGKSNLEQCQLEIDWIALISVQPKDYQGAHIVGSPIGFL